MGSLPIQPQPYFVNDVICRVSTPTEPGRTDGFSVVEIGVVEYPSTSFSDAGGLRTLEELIRNGFKGDFWVRWGHRSTDTLAHKKFTRERISASDKNVFLLDRHLSRGMYVRKIDGGGLGLVRDVETFFCIQTSGERVVCDIDAKELELNWISENVLGSYVMYNGWIGQIVEIDKIATSAMELDSEFVIPWTEKLNEFEFDRVKTLKFDSWEDIEMHLRFKTIGDGFQMTRKELSSMKWTKAPDGRGWTWPIRRPFAYANMQATVISIKVDNVLINWFDRFVTTPSVNPNPKPDLIMRFDDIVNLKNTRDFHVFSCTSPDNTTIGDNVFHLNGVTTTLQTTSYDRWVTSYLKDMSVRSQIIEPQDATRAKRPKTSHFDPDSYTGVGKFQLQDGMVSIQTPNGAYPGVVISRRSRVAVEFSPSHIESLPSTEVEPILLNNSLHFAPGSIVKVTESHLGPLTVVDSTFYGIVKGVDLSLQEHKTIVRLFRIPPESGAPKFESERLLSPKYLLPHPTFDMSPGDLLVRSNAHDTFTAGIFVQGLDTTGELLITRADGITTKIAPNRVMTLKKTALKTYLKPNFMGLVCCGDTLETFDNLFPTAEEDLDYGWVMDDDFGRNLTNLSKHIGIQDTNPALQTLAYWPRKSFVLHLDNIEFIEDPIRSVGHHFLKEFPHAIDPDMEPQQTKVLMDIVRGNGIMNKNVWFKFSMERKDLVFAAIEGPVGSFYEDVLLFFDIRVPPQEKMETKIFFHPFFEKIVIQSEGVAIQDKFSGLIRFSWNNETLPEIFQAEMPYDSKENSIPILLRFFSIISDGDLKQEPLNTVPSLGGFFCTGILLNHYTENERIADLADSNLRITRYIIQQLFEPPIAWQEEVLSYYRLHLPKYCMRVLLWIRSHESNLKKDVKHDLLLNLHELMVIYNKLF